VRLTTLNRQRANLVFSCIFQHAKLLSPNDVSVVERVFERDGVLRWCGEEVVGWARIGVSVRELLGSVGQHKSARTGSLHLQGGGLGELLDVFGEEKYVLWPAEEEEQAALIVLKEGCTAVDQLKAWAHALLLAKRLQGGTTSKGRLLAELRQTLKDVREVFEKHADTLMEKGWDLNVVALETRVGTRAYVDSGKQ
jgi:hypothetical protein